jgi:hypothetical protein
VDKVTRSPQRVTSAARPADTRANELTRMTGGGQAQAPRPVDLVVQRRLQGPDPRVVVLGRLRPARPADR